MTTPKWEVTIYGEAVREFQYLKRNHPAIWQRLVETLQALENEPNPAKPCNPELNVVPLRNMQPWCRGKVMRTCRFTFRMLQGDSRDDLTEICDLEIQWSKDTHIIQVTMIAPRTEYTYKLVGERQRDIWSQERAYD